MILSTDPVDSTSFLQCFPEKAYGSNSRSCAVLPPFCKPAYLNPLIPYLGKKIFRGSDWSAEKPQHCSEHIKRIWTLLGDKLLFIINLYIYLFRFFVFVFFFSTCLVYFLLVFTIMASRSSAFCI